MDETIERYPLSWPTGWKRTPASARMKPSFTQTEHKTVGETKIKRQADVSMSTAIERLETQLEKLGANNPTLSSNVRLRLDGRIDARNESVFDPGVAVYFRFKGRATVLACDRYNRVSDNIAALAAHIDALRRIERYGVGTLEQALAGYKSLPADTAADWRTVFGFNGGPVSAEQVTARYREMAQMRHPDKGGTEEGMMHLNRARDYALAELLNG